MHVLHFFVFVQSCKYIINQETIPVQKWSSLIDLSCQMAYEEVIKLGIVLNISVLNIRQILNHPNFREKLFRLWRPEVPIQAFVEKRFRNNKSQKCFTSSTKSF